MTKSILFFGGVPTAPDVDILLKHYKQPQEGAILKYEDIASIVKLDSSTSRFKTVLNSWRKRLFRDYNILMIPEPGIGLKNSTPSERINCAGSKMKTGRKMIFRSSTVAVTTDTDRLTSDEKIVRERLSVLPARLRLAEVTSAKQLPIPSLRK